MLRNVLKEFFHKDAHFRNLVMDIPVSVLVLRGSDFNVEFINNRLLMAFQKSWDDVYGKPFFSLFPELIEQGYAKIFKDVYNTGQNFSNVEVPIKVRALEQWQFIKLSVQPLINPLGRVTGIFIVGADVTDLVKARQQIAESEAKYRNVLELMDPGFSLMELKFDDNNKPVDYTMLEVNPALQRIMGIEDLVGKNMREIMPEVADFWIDVFGKVALTGEKVTVLHDVPEFEKSFESHAFRIGGNESHKVAVLINDVTDRVKKEELKELFAKRLEQQVAQRTRELEQSNADLKQFTHLISHDLKEPVRKIKIFTTLLTEELKENLSEAQQGYAMKIVAATDRLREMIEAIYDYSFADFNEHKVKDIDLNVLFTILFEDIDSNIKARNAEIVVEPLPVIEGIPIEIYQLFYNIISNSLKFARNDVTPHIEITSHMVKENGIQFVLISITDNGIGFEPCDEPKIFQSFSRLHPKDKYEGTGLGLSLSKKIVNRHGGVIRATGEPGKGATVTVKLPIKFIFLAPK